MLSSNSETSTYWKDAVRLALRHVSNGRNYEDMDASPPKELVQSIFDALLAVHKSPIQEAKQVTSRHKLHTFPVPSVDKFKIIYKKGIEWALPLQNGEKTTNNKVINDYFRKYDMSIAAHREWDDEYNLFLVKAQQSFNIASVAKMLSNVEGVMLADLLTPDGEGNDIVIKKLDNGWQIDYLIKFESCITGCKKKHGWSFKVNENSEVSFEREYGDPLPKWM